MQIEFKAPVKETLIWHDFEAIHALFLQGTKEGDEICVFSGGHIPFLVRRQATSRWYQLIRECYVHGMMNGEAIPMAGLEGH